MTDRYPDDFRSWVAVNLSLAACVKCGALVRDDYSSMLRHDQWHERIDVVLGLGTVVAQV
jgi:hypothetical protein